MTEQALFTCCLSWSYLGGREVVRRDVNITILEENSHIGVNLMNIQEYGWRCLSVFYNQLEDQWYALCERIER